MTQYFNVIIEKDSDGYLVASVPSLKGCHTQAKTFDQLMERIKEAIELCLEIEEDNWEKPEFLGVQRVAINRCAIFPV
ncbi:MAG TPA: type II toxin-antitoxin system HicB family antitoxin [Allocoleopsis sp.]